MKTNKKKHTENHIQYEKKTNLLFLFLIIKIDSIFVKNAQKQAKREFFSFFLILGYILGISLEKSFLLHKNWRSCQGMQANVQQWMCDEHIGRYNMFSQHISSACNWEK